MMTADPRLVPLCGDRLVKLLVSSEAAQQPKANAARLPSIDDSYEAPSDPEMSMDTVSHSPEATAHRILEHLRAQGFIRSAETSAE